MALQSSIAVQIKIRRERVTYRGEARIADTIDARGSGMQRPARDRSACFIAERRGGGGARLHTDRAREHGVAAIVCGDRAHAAAREASGRRISIFSPDTCISVLVQHGCALLALRRPISP